MKDKNYTRWARLFVMALFMLALPANLYTRPRVAIQPGIGMNGFFSADKAQRGRTIQAAIVMEIPAGYHVNANRPLGKFAVPTSLKIEAPGGIKVSPVGYPRPVVRRLKFSEDQLALYEGRAVMRFNVTVPANYQPGVTELRARLRYQSCNDEVCFPPVTRELAMPIGVVGANEPVKRINGRIFGGGRRTGK
ncbi:MAG TPA: protein-disulfide reductase DsbD N-terminal domain-containing protein [Pyrinomonadaceae bacterium]|jgi:DsbC/DsbD-like thiol-disulfide interchange protein